MEIFGKRICHTEGGIDALSNGITNQFPVNCFKKTVQKSGNTLCNLVTGVLDLIPWDAVQCGMPYISIVTLIIVLLSIAIKISLNFISLFPLFLDVLLFLFVGIPQLYVG